MAPRLPDADEPRRKWQGSSCPVKFLVTGGAGFIGSHVADALVARGDEVVILDDLSTGSRGNIEHLLGDGKAELVVGTVLDAELVDSYMRSADACLHFAA